MGAYRQPYNDQREQAEPDWPDHDVADQLDRGGRTEASTGDESKSADGDRNDPRRRGKPDDGSPTAQMRPDGPCPGQR